MPKRKKIIIIIVLAVFAAAGFFYFNSYKSKDLSPDQAEILAEFGLPSQFSISYLPSGDSGKESRFVREEKWFYPDLGAQLTFWAGRLVANEDLKLKNKVSYGKTVLRPQDFSYRTTVDDVRRLIGAAELAPMEVPGFFGGGVETYVYPGGVFVFENGYLTYMQTID